MGAGGINSENIRAKTRRAYYKNNKVKYNTCDPKYYGSGVNNCDNGIKGLRELLDKIKKESADEDKS